MYILTKSVNVTSSSDFIYGVNARCNCHAFDILTMGVIVLYSLQLILVTHSNTRSLKLDLLFLLGRKFQTQPVDVDYGTKEKFTENLFQKMYSNKSSMQRHALWQNGSN